MNVDTNYSPQHIFEGYVLGFAND